MRLPKPFEVSIETTGECNYYCEFCFTKNFLERGLPSKKQLKKTIKKIASEGIDRVRFTGGEPLLRQDLPELVSFAKQHGLFASLNTNASLLSEAKVSELSSCLDDILVSLHAFNESNEAKLCGKRNFFEKKLHAIEQLSEQGVFVRAATILSKENISQLAQFHSLIENLPVSQWVLLRPISNPLITNPVSSADIAKAVEKILGFNKGKEKGKHTLIENALPFCCYSPEKVKEVALGGLREDGHSSLFIDSSLNIKPSYFLDLPLGNALKDSIMDCWKSSFMRRMHALEFIAEPCHECKYVRKCMSGSRFSALICNQDLYALDPLANPKKYRKELFK